MKAVQKKFKEYQGIVENLLAQEDQMNRDADERLKRQAHSIYDRMNYEKTQVDEDEHESLEKKH